MVFTQQGMGIGYVDREGETFPDYIAMVGVGLMSGLHSPFFLVYFEFPLETISTNESLIIDEKSVFGRLFYSDSSFDFQLIELGTFYGGEIEFGDWSTDENATINGSISSSYYSFREIEE